MCRLGVVFCCSILLNAWLVDSCGSHLSNAKPQHHRSRRELTSKLGIVAGRAKRLKSIERKLEKQKPCLQSVYVTEGQSSKISCYPSKNKKLLMRELVDKYRYIDESVARNHESLTLKYEWRMHAGISPMRAWVDKHYNFNIFNMTSDDSGKIECHVSIMTANTDKNARRAVRHLKSFVFRKVLLSKVYPKFSSAAVLSYPMSEDCHSESSKVKPM